VLHETFWRDDLDPARVDFVLGHDSLDPAEVIDMAVRVDDRHDQPVAAVLAVQCQRRGGGLG